MTAPKRAPRILLVLPMLALAVIIAATLAFSPSNAAPTPSPGPVAEVVR